MVSGCLDPVFCLDLFLWPKEEIQKHFPTADLVTELIVSRERGGP